VAYGARLESALGASPRGFESPILRKRNDRLLGGLFVCWGYVVWDSNVRWGPIGVAQRRLWGPFSAQKTSLPLMSNHRLIWD
jgi:hypothetical protein